MKSTGGVYISAAVVVLLCLMGAATALLPFETQWQPVATASFYATSVNMFMGSFEVPEVPVERDSFFAMVIKLESITVTEGVATILTWDRNVSAYMIQLYYTPNGFDQVYSDSIYVHPGAQVQFYEQWDYQYQMWTAGVNVSQSGASLFLSFPEDLTLGLASVELWTQFSANYSWPDCGRMPRSNLVGVSNIGSNCGFIGCGPWLITSMWSQCQTTALAKGPQVVFTFNSTSNYELEQQNEGALEDIDNVKDKLSLEFAPKDQLIGDLQKIASAQKKKKYM